MSFYDFDLEKQIAGQHILWEIKQRIRFSSLVYRLKDLKTEVGRNGWLGMWSSMHVFAISL